MLWRNFSPPDGSAGKNFSQRRPNSRARSMSDGVQIPGAKGKPGGPGPPRSRVD